MNELVSVITPSYNSASFIEDSINSVIQQTYDNWELIIVDDASTDHSRDIINRMAKKDKRILPIFFSNNSGSATARNTAINNSKGRFIAFLDADDMWRKEKLEKQIAFMRENDFAFSFTSYQPISEDRKKLYREIKVPKVIDYDGLLKNTIIGCLTVVIDTKKVNDIKMPNLRTSQDLALWLSILKRGTQAYGIEENLAFYRVVKQSSTSNKLKVMLGVWKIYRDYENLNFIKSLWCFLNYGFNALKKRI